MNKAKQARVRDELLQQLYTGVLRAELAAAAAGAMAHDAAAAAAVCANLDSDDTLLVPARGAESFRILRGLPRRPGAMPTERERASRVYTLPATEPEAVAFTLAMALAAEQYEPCQAVCVVIPRRRRATPGPRAAMPTTWTQLAQYAAKLALPVLFISLGGPPHPGTADPRIPAPRYPTMPVDSEDSLAAYRVAYESLARARAQGGPSHLEAVHLRDTLPALQNLEAALRRRSRFTKAWQRAVERRLTAEIAQP